MSFAELLLKRMREQQAEARGEPEAIVPRGTVSPPVPQPPQDEMLEAVRRWKTQNGLGASRILTKEEYEKIRGGA
jgi:hypothetical protein